MKSSSILHSILGIISNNKRQSAIEQKQNEQQQKNPLASPSVFLPILKSRLNYLKYKHTNAYAYARMHTRSLANNRMWQNGIKTFHKFDSTQRQQQQKEVIFQMTYAQFSVDRALRDPGTKFCCCCCLLLAVVISFRWFRLSFVILCHLSIFHLQWHCDFSFKRWFSIHFVLMLIPLCSEPNRENYCCKKWTVNRN